jgi:tetratricopeptide (TPR) repeat protein
LNINFLQLKVNELYFSKNYEATILYLNKLDSLDFKSVNTYEMFGMCYYNLKDYKLAETSFKNALKIDRADAKIYYRLGTLYYDQKNYQTAKLYLMQSLTYGKGDLDKQYLLFGTIEKEEGNLKQAIHFFDEAFKNNYDNSMALFELATTSDTYYEDKKIAYKYYENYIRKFKNTDESMTNYADQRLLDIKKQLFIEGEIIE